MRNYYLKFVTPDHGIVYFHIIANTYSTAEFIGKQMAGDEILFVGVFEAPPETYN